MGGLVGGRAASGASCARYEYGPFHELIRASGPVASENHFQAPTKYRDSETGLYYYGYRYYNPSTGRWLSRDPIGETGGVNLHEMDGNDPMQCIDSDGRVVLQAFDQAAQDWTDPYKSWYHPRNMGALGASALKSFYVVFSLGTVCKNDRLADRNLAGEITDGQFWKGGVMNTGTALASLAAGGGAASMVARAGGNLALQGAAAGFSSSLTEVAGTRGGYAMVDIRYEGTVSGDALQIASGTLVGAAVGGGAQLRQTLGGAAGASGRLNLAQGDDISGLLEDIRAQPGFYDVLGHGTPKTIKISSSEVKLNAADLARLLAVVKSYMRQNIRLLSCECGKGFNSLGAQLARRMYVVVKAPNQKLWTYPGRPGKYTIQAGEEAPGLPMGGWETFSPFNVYMPMDYDPDQRR